MLISVQEAAGFLNTHHKVFDALWRRHEEALTEPDLLSVIGAAQTEATPVYLLAQLKRLRFLTGSESTAGTWELAPPFARWLEHLQQVARPVSSALVHGRLTELDHFLASFRLAEARGDLPTGRDVLRDARQSFLRLIEDLAQTRAAIAATVREAKGDHGRQSAVERFRRINRLWHDYLVPLMDLLDPAGRLEAICVAWEQQLALALEKKFLPERRSAERIEGEMQVLRVAVRQSFRECRSELEPLHARLRRETQWAEGAARILADLDRTGAAESGLATSLRLSGFRLAGQMATAALRASAAGWREMAVAPAPIDFAGAPTAADSQAVEDILVAIEKLGTDAFPMPDLLAWLAQHHGTRGFNPVLQVFSLLVTDSRYRATFHFPLSDYDIAGGVVRCGRVRLALPRAA